MSRTPSPTMNSFVPPPSPPPRLRHYRTMTTPCFVCQLPILSHQVGLVWTGGDSGWDELTRMALEESILRQRLGSRRDSGAQAFCRSALEENNAEPQRATPRRRRSSLAQLSDFFRDLGSGGSSKRNKKSLNRRETLADVARSVPRHRSEDSSKSRRRESSADSGLKSTKRRRSKSASKPGSKPGSKPATPSTESRFDFWNWGKKNPASRDKTKKKKKCDSGEEKEPRRESIDEILQRLRRASAAAPSRIVATQRKRSTSPYHKASFADAASEATGACPAPARKPTVTIIMAPNHKDLECKTSGSGMPTIITSAVTPSPTSPTRPQTQILIPAAQTLGIDAIPKTTDAIPKSTGAIPKIVGASPKTTGTILKSTGAIPKSTGAIPETTGGMPKSTGAIPESTGAIPQSTGAIPKTTGTILKSTGAILKSTGAIPETTGGMPKSTGAIPESTGAIPKSTGAIPKSSGAIYESTGAIPKTTNESSRRDSTTQCGKSRKNSRAGVSPERRMVRLQRQATAYDDSAGPSGARRRDSGGSTLGPDEVRRDSLSPDSAVRPRRERSQLSPDRAGGSELSPAAAKRKGRLRRQVSCARGRRPHSPDSSSGSSREPSPCPRRERTIIRRQSTTEEILIARGFRRQSTTEEMIRCRNFRRQSIPSDDACMRSKGRRESSTQIVDGTVNTMTVETTSTFFEMSTQTEPSPEYENNHYHEECLRCNSCGMNLTGQNQKRARRYKNQILCDLHFTDVARMETNDFMQQLRSFKPHSLGVAVARRKSSTTLIFPLPSQACSDEFCEEYPHNLDVVPGYWIECSRQKVTSDTIWEYDLSESENEYDGPDAYDATGRKHMPGSLDDVEEGNEAAGTSASTSTSRRKKKTPIEEQWERSGGFELTSGDQDIYERYFFGHEHWNYYSTDEDLGPVVLSIKQDTINSRDQFRIQVRAVSHTVHGLIPASSVFADRYNREEVVKSLGREINITPPLQLGLLDDTPQELLKLDQVFIKSELKVGVMYVAEGQHTEAEILDNNETTPMFDEFLNFIGDKVSLKGFDKYRGGLDTLHDLTGAFSIYTVWRGIEVMFHISTFLPNEEHDPQKVHRKRHIGNDIVCLVFLEADNTTFSPACIKSHFLHTFIIVRASPKIKRRPTRYEISVVSRDEVTAYKPYLWEQCVFDKGPMFREWLLTKIVNGERASYGAPKFATMQERTRSQMLQDLVANLQNHAETGLIPKPYRRGSWRPIGHMRPSSPLLDSVRNQFEDHDALSRDFTKAFTNKEENATKNHLFDVTFLVGQSKVKKRIKGVRAILAVRSRVFQEMLYGIQAGFGSPQGPVADVLSRPAPSLVTQPPSRRQTSSSNFLQVPDVEAPRPKSVPSSPMVKRAFSRLGTLTAGWGRSIRKQHSQLNTNDRKKSTSSHDCSGKVKEKGKGKKKGGASAVPRLSVCADQQKVDKSKLEQTEFIIIEFEPDTFSILLDYLHTGCCRLSCLNIPGLICAAEHFDLPELLQACFHHAKQFLKTEVVCPMLMILENYYWRYTSASELMNMILAFAEQRAYEVFQTDDFLELSESMVQMIMCRNLEVAEIRKFEAMLSWAHYKVQFNTPRHLDKAYEFQCIINRMTRDLKLSKITPQELIKVVLPTKTIKNEKILETLMHQANSGVYHVNQNHIQAVQKQETTTTTTTNTTNTTRTRTRPAEMESIDLGI